MKFRIALLIALLFAAASTYSLDKNNYICEATEDSYKKFFEENSELYHNNFRLLSKIYLDTLVECPKEKYTFLRVRAIYEDPRVDEEVQSLVIDYFSKTAPLHGTVEWNKWSNDVYVFAGDPSLTSTSMKNIYHIAEINEDDTIAFHIASNHPVGRFIDTYDMVINDYVRKGKTSPYRDNIFEGLLRNADKHPLLKSDYLVLASSKEKSVKELALLRYESNSEEEYLQKLNILNQENEIEYQRWYKFKVVIFLLPFFFIFLISPLHAVRRRQSTKIVIYKFLIWAPHLAIIASILIWVKIFPLYPLWLLAIGIGFLIYKIRSLKWEIALSIGIISLLIIIACVFLFAIAGLAGQGAGQ